MQEDITSLAKNKSFVFSTLAFTCVTFCRGALSWWGPDFIKSGLKTMKEEDRGIAEEKVELIFGVVTMMSGIVGVPLGMILSTQLKAKFPRADPVICATGILISAIFLTIGMMITNINIYACFACLFLGEVALNLNWSIVADMLLYIVTPTCRSTAEAIQILASHAFGDAGSPYLIGLVSDGLLGYLSDNREACPEEMETGECVEESQYREYKYQSLLYSLLTNCGVEVIGGILFLITAIYIVRDKLQCEKAAAGNCDYDLASDRDCVSQVRTTRPLLSSSTTVAPCLCQYLDQLWRLITDTSLVSSELHFKLKLLSPILLAFTAMIELLLLSKTIKMDDRTCL